MHDRRVPLRHGGITAHTAAGGTFAGPRAGRSASSWCAETQTWPSLQGRSSSCHRVWRSRARPGLPPALQRLLPLHKLAWTLHTSCQQPHAHRLEPVWDSWMDACVSHRFIIVPLLGYMLPLVTLYIWEMRDRWIFAQERTIPTSSLWQSILQGLPYVIYDVAFHISVAVCLLTDWIKYM
eukprot:jgi/Botrbrau1/9717/Bobra.0388s0010.1